MRRRKVRFIDIAEAARVGIATVDRVLNERGPVSPQTADLVLGAARRLGLNRALPERYQRRLRFEAMVYRRILFWTPTPMNALFSVGWTPASGRGWNGR